MFNGAIGGWDVSNVANMADMFYRASAFDQDLSKWKAPNIQVFTNMFTGSGLEKAPQKHPPFARSGFGCASPAGRQAKAVHRYV
jgi:hypothetical protein